MRVSGRPTRGCPTESDRSCRPFPQGLVALYRGIDVPVLGRACAGEASAALGLGPRCTLRHLHSELNRLALHAHHRPRYNEVTAVVGHDGERVNGGGSNGCEGQRCDAYAHEAQDRDSRHEALQMLAGRLSKHGAHSFPLMAHAIGFSGRPMVSEGESNSHRDSLVFHDC